MMRLSAVILAASVAVLVPSMALAQEEVDLLEDLLDDPSDKGKKKAPPAQADPPKKDEKDEESKGDEPKESTEDDLPDEPMPRDDDPGEADPLPPEAQEPKLAPRKKFDPTRIDKVKSVQRKPVLKRGRLELTPMAMASVNDAFFNHFALGGSATYYLHDSLGIGLSGVYWYAHPRTDNVRIVRRAQNSVLAVFESPDLAAMLDLVWTPIYGKMSLFNSWIVPLDFYVVAGFGAVKVGSRYRGAVQWGLGQRFFITDWMAFRLEVRDYIYVDRQVVNNLERSDTQNFLMVQAGVSFFIPPSFEYGR